jgi:hypothetical protein
MEKKRKKRPIRSPEERERWEYNQLQFKKVLAQALERDGASPEEIRRRLGDLNDPY